ISLSSDPWKSLRLHRNNHRFPPLPVLQEAPFFLHRHLHRSVLILVPL
ncbi:hypothetical protein A2U01_0096167, partial [Trifolium medium]|nr:hypothetical protein [Trifolium medium]